MQVGTETSPTREPSESDVASVSRAASRSVATDTFTPNGRSSLSRAVALAAGNRSSPEDALASGAPPSTPSTENQRLTWNTPTLTQHAYATRTHTQLLHTTRIPHPCTARRRAHRWQGADDVHYTERV